MKRATPNNAIDRSDEQRVRCWVPVALRALAPGHRKRWASEELAEYTFPMLTITSNVP
jgi:hypothetical protein